MNEKTIEHAAKAVKSIIQKYGEGNVIKDFEFPALVNMETLETLGFVVSIQLSTAFNYDEATLKEWKEMLCADNWRIHVMQNQLWVKYEVRYNKNNN